MTKPEIVPLVLTAPTERDLEAVTASLAGTGVDTATGLRTLGRDLAARAELAHPARRVVAAQRPGDVAALADAAPVPTTHAGLLAFLFSGQSSQRVGMGTELAAVSGRFAAVLDDLEATVGRHVEHSPAGVRSGSTDSDGVPLLHRSEAAQPALMVHALALSDLLAAVGVVPDLVAGHSFGEIAAAAAAGVWSRADACGLAAGRGRLIDELAGPGAMVAIEAGEAEVAAALDGPDMVVSAVHGERAVVVAGPCERMRALAATFTARGVRTSELPMALAAHSPAMEPVLEPLRALFAAVDAHPSAVPLAGNADGALLAPWAPASARHWVRHCRETVRWSDAVGALRAAGAGTYLEIGPSGVLSRLSTAGLPQDEQGALIPAVTSEPDEVTALLRALVRLEQRGHRVDWAAALGTGRAVVGIG